MNSKDSIKFYCWLGVILLGFIGLMVYTTKFDAVRSGEKKYLSEQVSRGLMTTKQAQALLDEYDREKAQQKKILRDLK